MLKILRARLGDAERGLALVIVISVGAVLTIFVTIMMSYGITAYTKSAADARWNAAIAAAYAGIEEYQSRLANDPSYVRFGNPAAPFSAGSPVTLPPETNPAFGVGVNGSWATVPDSGGDASFRYEIDSSDYVATGTLRVRSTGRVGDATRTIVADLRQEGFLDFIYFTDYEMQDPQASGVDLSCVRYDWQQPRLPIPGNQNPCGNIAFGSNDVINGPAHSNDTIRACDTTFKGPVTTSNRGNPRYRAVNSNNVGCGGQVFEVPGSPAVRDPLPMPQTNTELRREVRDDLTSGDVPRPGCLYTGPTTIRFNSNGTITVVSPWTRATRVSGQPASGGSQPAACGVITDLRRSSGSTFTPPENNVIYVQNVPSVSTDPNHWATNARPQYAGSTLQCRGESGSDVRGVNGSPATVTGNGIGFPRQNERAPRQNSYGCRSGDAFVQGSMNGRLTVAAENFVYVTGNIQYVDDRDDMLGLIGNNSIFIWNPVSANNGSALLGGNRRIVDAALLSVERTMEVQNYDRGGNRGTLEINGAIAQKFRGIVREGNNGYAKAYNYDPRLRYTAPPKFLSPTTTTYGINVWIETERAFNADGSAR